jgi:hypothetical protein
MKMSYRPSITNVTKASSNDKEGLYEFIIKLADGTECRAFYQSVSGMENDEHQPPAQDAVSGMPQGFHLQMHGVPSLLISKAK